MILSALILFYQELVYVLKTILTLSLSSLPGGFSVSRGRFCVGSVIFQKIFLLNFISMNESGLESNGLYRRGG